MTQTLNVYLLVGDKWLDEEVLENSVGFSHLRIMNKISLFKEMGMRNTVKRRKKPIRLETTIEKRDNTAALWSAYNRCFHMNT